MKIKIFVIACLVLLTVSCIGKIRYPEYYTLELAPNPRAAAADPQRLGTLAVRPFVTPEYLRQGRIVYREAPDEVGFYEYHRWAADPGAAITTGVIETFRSSGLFSSVVPYDGHAKPEYLLSGRLERMDEIDYGGGVSVEVKLSAQVVNLRTGATLWGGDVAETSRVEKRTLESVVAEMSNAVQTAIDRLMADMARHLA